LYLLAYQPLLTAQTGAKIIKQLSGQPVVNVLILSLIWIIGKKKQPAGPWAKVPTGFNH
jgi:hypothetical protein